MLSLSAIYHASYAQEHSDEKAVHSMAITAAIFQEKLQGSLENHCDWIKIWENEENPHSPFLEETWHSYSLSTLNSLAARVYLCQTTTSNGAKTEEIALERFDYPVHGVCTTSHLGLWLIDWWDLVCHGSVPHETQLRLRDQGLSSLTITTTLGSSISQVLESGTCASRLQEPVVSVSLYGMQKPYFTRKPGYKGLSIRHTPLFKLTELSNPWQC